MLKLQSLIAIFAVFELHNKMIAMLFGTIPIAHKTGGLKDSIKEGYNGFLFSAYSSGDLEKKVIKAANMWKNDKPAYVTMVQNALKTDFSWNKSAQEYISLYDKLVRSAS